MAQPLTVLRGALGALELRGATAAESTRYVEISSRQVDRLCDLLAGMRDLLDRLEGIEIKLPLPDLHQRNLEAASDCASSQEIQRPFD